MNCLFSGCSVWSRTSSTARSSIRQRTAQTTANRFLLKSLIFISGLVKCNKEKNIFSMSRNRKCIFIDEAFVEFGICSVNTHTPKALDINSVWKYITQMSRSQKFYWKLYPVFKWASYFIKSKILKLIFLLKINENSKCYFQMAYVAAFTVSAYSTTAIR